MLAQYTCPRCGGEARVAYLGGYWHAYCCVCAYKSRPQHTRPQALALLHTTLVRDAMDIANQFNPFTW